MSSFWERDPGAADSMNRAAPPAEINPLQLLQLITGEQLHARTEASAHGSSSKRNQGNDSVSSDAAAGRGSQMDTNGHGVASKDKVRWS